MVNKPNCYYVYMLIDPRDQTPFYVGKGKDARMYIHSREALNYYKNSNKPHHHKIRQINRDGLIITYEKIIVNVSEEIALQKEKHLIEQIGRRNENTGPLLNLTPGGMNSGTTSKPVSQYSLDGDLISHFPSAKIASETVPKANRSYITQVCKGKRKSAGGFIWTYKDAPVPLFTKQYYKAVNQLTKDGEFVANYKSLTEAQSKTGVELHNISECCRGNSKTAGGYKWLYYPPH